MTLIDKISSFPASDSLGGELSDRIPAIWILRRSIDNLMPNSREHHGAMRPNIDQILDYLLGQRSDLDITISSRVTSERSATASGLTCGCST
jgi:hypothetical protein